MSDQTGCDHCGATTQAVDCGVPKGWSFIEINGGDEGIFDLCGACLLELRGWLHAKEDTVEQASEERPT
jgi:hypothetical protein